MAFVTMLLCANLIGASKVPPLAAFPLARGSVFPLSYVFGDVLTEVYATPVLGAWFGRFAAMILPPSWPPSSKLPPASDWHDQAAYETVYGATPRIVIAYCLPIGEVNLPIPTFGKNEISSKGKHLWMRTIGSTVIGEGIDTAIFYPLAFYGVWETPLLINVLFMDYCIKVGWEAVATPITYRVVAFLKQAENEDYYDRDTDFTPFSIET